MANILIINQYATTPEFGFGGRSFYFAQELQRLGHKLTLISSSFHHLQHKQPKTKGFITQLLSNEINVILIKTFAYIHAYDKKRVINWFIFMFGLLLLSFRLKDRPDVIMYSSPSLIGYLGALYLAKKMKAKLIFDVRDIWPLSIIELGGYSHNHPFIRLLSFIEKTAYQRSHLITFSMHGFPSYLKEIGHKKNNFLWLANGVDHNALTSEATNNIEPAISFEKNKFTIGYLGTIGVANAIDTLIEAADLLQEDENIQFVLVGGGKEKPTLQKLVAQRGLKNILFFDAVPKNQVASVIQQFNVCFIGSQAKKIYQYGVSPQKIPEYMFCGKPVLCAYSGKSDPLFNSQSGKTIESNNPEALAQAVAAFKRMKPSELEVLGKKGQEFAQKKLSYQVISFRLHAELEKF